MKAPTVSVTKNQNNTYTLSWGAVAYADTYRIKHRDTYISATATTYTVSNDSPVYDDNGTGELTVCAFDSNADYFISADSATIQLKKLFSLTLNRNNNSAGSITPSRIQSYKVGDGVTTADLLKSNLLG